MVTNEIIQLVNIVKEKKSTIRNFESVVGISVIMLPFFPAMNNETIELFFPAADAASLPPRLGPILDAADVDLVEMAHWIFCIGRTDVPSWNDAQFRKTWSDSRPSICGMY